MNRIELGIDNDLGVDWDPKASRLARVLVSHGRIEIVLCDQDYEWVNRALATMAEQIPIIVVACPDKGGS